MASRKMREAQKRFIEGEALTLFLEKSIVRTTIVNIARRVGIGEATVYRYFEKKDNIIIGSAKILANRVFENYFSFTNLKSYDIVTGFYNNFLKIFNEHIEYYRFIDEFDRYAYEENYELNDYEELVNQFKDKFVFAYNDCYKNGQVKKIENIDVFYIATTHALLDLCKRLSRDKGILPSDVTKDDKEVRTLIDIILNNIVKEQ